ncbi:hypothetical protein KJ980_08915 [Patescibacteria group bacterium]|nr:hypothetical protein [Patescibacteria group bacterium]
MPRVSLTSKFQKARKKWTRGNNRREKQLKQAFLLFTQNSKHPSLNLEKLSGSDIWTIRIDRGNRLFFVWADEEYTAIFFFVGHHDAYRTVKK